MSSGTDFIRVSFQSFLGGRGPRKIPGRGLWTREANEFSEYSAQGQIFSKNLGGKLGPPGSDVGGKYGSLVTHSPYSGPDMMLVNSLHGGSHEAFYPGKETLAGNGCALEVGKFEMYMGVEQARCQGCFNSNDMGGQVSLKLRVGPNSSDGVPLAKGNTISHSFLSLNHGPNNRSMYCPQIMA